MHRVRAFLALSFCCLALAFGLPATVITAPPCAAAEQASDAPVADQFATQRFLDLHKNGSLELTGSLAQATVTDKDAYSGVMLEGKRSVLESGRIQLGTYDFGAETVGRITVDGLSERGWTATVHIYLDDAEEPAADIIVPHQQGKVGWAIAGDRTISALAEQITGEHSISIGISATRNSAPEADKKTSVLLRSIEFAQSSLPTIYFDIDETQGTIESMNNSDDHSKECYGSMTVQTPAGYVSEYGDGSASTTLTETEYVLDYIRGRGNSTWMTDKRPYKVKLENKADLFGMGENKHWVLLANRYDNSLMRNKATYWLGQELGMEFTPQCVFVDVVMNGEYYGSYYLCEQIRVGKSRVDIADLEDEPGATEGLSVTGGYLLSMEQPELDEGDVSAHGFATKGGTGFTIESPGFEDYTNSSQVGYIKDFVQKLEDAVYASDYKVDGKSYDEYLDVASAVDYYWIQCVSCNGDAYGSGSTYLYKDRDTETAVSKLHWGPLWDFDYVAWGDLEYDGYSVEGFELSFAPWAERLLTNDAFARKMIDRWPTLKGKLQELTRTGGMLDTWRDELKVSRYYDEEKYGPYDEGSWYGSYAGYAKGGSDGGASGSKRTYAEEVEQLRGWIDQRIAWVDENLGSLRPVKAALRFYADGKLVETREGIVGRAFGSLPQAPTKKGYTFTGWYYEDPEDGNAITVDSYCTVPAANVKLIAEYVSDNDIVKPKGVYFQQKDVYCSAGYGMFYMPHEVVPNDAVNNLTWTSSDSKVATVSDDGTVEVLEAGTATITATCSNGVKASFTLHVVGESEAEDMRDIYELIVPKTVTVKEGAYRKIAVTTDPERAIMRQVEWMSLDEDVATVGEAGVVQGMGTGTTYIVARLSDSNVIAVCKVTVKARALDIAKKAKVAAVPTQAYTGKKVRPKLKVTYKGKKLKLKRDYTVKYRDNKKMGKAKAVISFKGAYTGKKTVRFSIGPRGTSIKKLTKANRGFTVRWKRQASNTTGYRVQYSASKTFKKGAKTVQVKGTKAVSRKVDGLKAKRAYYVRVGTYKKVGGKTHYSAWSKARKVKTK